MLNTRSYKVKHTNILFYKFKFMFSLLTDFIIIRLGDFNASVVRIPNASAKNLFYILLN